MGGGAATFQSPSAPNAWQLPSLVPARPELGKPLLSLGLSVSSGPRAGRLDGPSCADLQQLWASQPGLEGDPRSPPHTHTARVGGQSEGPPFPWKHLEEPPHW